MIVGFLPNQLASYEQIDFNNCLGKNVILRKSGIIIKIPKSFDESLFDYSIIFPRDFQVELEISYDRIEK